MTVIYRHDEWDAQRTTVRLCSALLAAGVTLLLILALSRPLGIIKTSDTFVHPVSAMLLQFPLNIRLAVDAAQDTPAATHRLPMLCVRYATNQPRLPYRQALPTLLKALMYLSLPP
jgi:hypothetical protein